MCVVDENPRPPALAAVDAAVINMATDPRLEASLRDGHRQQVVLGGFEVAKPLGEDRERLLDGCRNDDVSVNLGSGRLRHLVSSTDRSITSPYPARVRLQKVSSWSRSAATPAGSSR